MFTNNHDKQEVNAQYTALAVNNLHILAEALQNFVTEVENANWEGGKNPFKQMPVDIYLKATEALNRIS